MLLVDLDPQGNATTGLGFAKSDVKNSVYNTLIDEAPVPGIALKTSIANLDLLPSNIDLAGAEVELVYMKDRERVLKKMLDEVKGFYDYITIDCPPSLGCSPSTRFRRRIPSSSPSRANITPWRV